MARYALSARSYHRILKVARTIADLAGAGTVAAAHVAEAISMRRLDAPAESDPSAAGQFVGAKSR